MKLVRYGDKFLEQPGAIDESGQLRDLSGVIADIDYRSLNDKTLYQLQKISLNELPIISSESVRLGPCVNPVGKVICVGFNSKVHVEQMKLKPASELVFFLKANSAISGAYDPVVYPKVGQKLDWEAELAVVIGKTCHYVSEPQAREFILGYTCMNDFSDRYWQFERDGGGGQHTKGKSFDGFGPLGPYLVTKDEIANPDQLDISLSVNGELRQCFNTSDYIYGVDAAVSYLSQLFTLYPGDVIALGSGPGNASHWQNTYLKPGDQLQFAIESLGVQECQIIAET